MSRVRVTRAASMPRRRFLAAVHNLNFALDWLVMGLCTNTSRIIEENCFDAGVQVLLKNTMWIAAMISLIPAAAYAGGTNKKEVETPQAYKDLVACRSVVDSAARLACFDREAAAFDAATQSRQVVIADREAVKAARRGLFGFAAPIGKLIGFGGQEDEADEIKTIESTVAHVGRTRGGELQLRLQDASVWEQNDTRSFVLSPKEGNTVKITRGALGSYFVSVQGQRGIKMRRVE